MCSAGGASENGSSGESGAIEDEASTEHARGEVLEQEPELTGETSQSYNYNEKQPCSTNVKKITNDLPGKCMVKNDNINNQRVFFRGGGENLGSEEYARLACEGIRLMLNNRSIEAEELFRHHTDDNLHMAMGYCYISFMNAVMSFEEEKVQQSMNILRGMERRCGAPGDNGWFSSVKNIVLGARNGIDTNEVASSFLEQQIILADAQVLLAILTFLSQGLAHRSSWGRLQEESCALRERGLDHVTWANKVNHLNAYIAFTTYYGAPDFPILLGVLLRFIALLARGPYACKSDTNMLGSLKWFSRILDPSSEKQFDAVLVSSSMI